MGLPEKTLEGWLRVGFSGVMARMSNLQGTLPEGPGDFIGLIAEEEMRTAGIAALAYSLFVSGVLGADVKEHGAIGDGRADDTAAIQRAVELGGTVTFPDGTYRITKTITVKLDETGYTALSASGAAKLVMAGPGPAVKFVGTNEAKENLVRSRAQVWDREARPLVNGLRIEGDHDAADGIQAEGTVQFTVTGTQIRGVRNGIHLTKSNRNVVISNSHIYANRGIGVFYDDVYVHQSNITGCHISYNLGGGIVSRAGDVRNIQIGTCDLEANLDPDGPPAANVLLDSRGASKGVAEIEIVGCTIQHTYKGPGGANVRIIGAGQEDEDTDIRKGNVTIANNVLSDVQVNVHLQNVRGAVVSGNTMWRGYAHNILIEGSQDVVVASNTLGRSPRYSTRGRPTETNAVLIRHSKDVIFNANVLSQTRGAPAGLSVIASKRVNVTNSTLVDCDGPEILLDDVSLVRISDCILNDDRKDAPNIKQSGGSRIQIVDNLQDLGPTP